MHRTLATFDELVLIKKLHILNEQYPAADPAYGQGIADALGIAVKDIS